MSYGAVGKKWLENIPQIIKKYEQIWQIKVLSSYNLTYNYVAPVVCQDGSRAVIKIGIPQDKEFRTEIEALSVFKGAGSVRLLREDRINGVILLEEINPGLPLSSLEDDEGATRILAKVMKKLWKPLVKNHRFIIISDWTRALYEYPKKFKIYQPIPLYLVDKAIKLFKELIDTSTEPVLTHGDLHYDNVLSSNRDEWLAIDPKGIAAERAYETAAMIRNPYKKISAMKNIEDLLKRRILILAEELNFDPKRIHQWCLAQTILSGVWTAEEKKDTQHALKAVQALIGIKF